MCTRASPLFPPRHLSLIDVLAALPLAGGISIYELAGTLDADPEEVRSLFLAYVEYFHWDWDYDARGGAGDYVLSGTERGRSLLEIERPALVYPALTQDAHPSTAVMVSEGWGLGEEVSWAVAGSADHPNRRSCGHVVKVGAASSDPKKGRRVKRDWCYDTLCPVCWGAWASRAKDKIIDRITGGIELWYRQGVDLGPVKCAVVSPPQEYAIEALYSVKSFQGLRKKFKLIMDSSGVTAGIYVRSPCTWG